MSIQQNINQTLSLASFITNQRRIMQNAATGAIFEAQKEEARKGYETAKAEHQRYLDVPTEKAKWKAAQEEAKRADDRTNPEFYDLEKAQWRRNAPSRFAMGKDYQEGLEKARKDALTAAEHYNTFGAGLVSSDEIAALRGLPDKTTPEEQQQEMADASRLGRTRLEDKRLKPKGGIVLP